MRRTIAIAFIVMGLVLPAHTHACELPFDFPPGFTLFEDGSWRASDGTTGCLPTWACEDQPGDLAASQAAPHPLLSDQSQSLGMRYPRGGHHARSFARTQSWPAQGAIDPHRYTGAGEGMWRNLRQGVT